MARQPLTPPPAMKLAGTLFVLTFFVGAGSIIALKIVGANQIVVTATPVAIMLVYAGAVLIFRRLRVRLDQAGDNLYYLGFLFTLTSLAYSLYEFAPGEGATSLIIGNFGIAIATTIVGLMLRVLFNQMRTDPIETEQLARIELAEAARRLRTELDEAALNFNMFCRSMQQMVSDGHQETHKITQETLAKFGEAFVYQMSALDEKIASATSAFEAFDADGEGLNRASSRG